MDYIYSEIDPKIAIDANQLLQQADETDIGKVVTVTGKNQYGLKETSASDVVIVTISDFDSTTMTGTSSLTHTQIADAASEGKIVILDGNNFEVEDAKLRAQLQYYNSSSVGFATLLYNYYNGTQLLIPLSIQIVDNTATFTVFDNIYTPSDGGGEVS